MKFEGEYLYGRKWFGKGYNISNEVIYELKNGNGYAKKYNSDNILKFEGEYKNGEKKGNGAEYYDNGKCEFKGKYFNGEKKEMVQNIMIMVI